MEEIIKISTFCIIVAMIVVLIKSIRPDMGIGVLVAASIVIFTYIAILLGQVFDVGQNIVNSSGLQKDDISLIFKIIAATYVIEFARGICVDAGELGLAQKIEMCGRIYLIMLVLPTCITLISTITSFVG
ncbi:MAG: hypothetical protein E7385_05790 [Ruminococcaceae bacterium]|nr:hypothetical protein [Oscillospiraceae bacterium]